MMAEPQNAGKVYHEAESACQKSGEPAYERRPGNRYLIPTRHQKNTALARVLITSLLSLAYKCLWLSNLFLSLQPGSIYSIPLTNRLRAHSKHWMN